MRSASHERRKCVEPSTSPALLRFGLAAGVVACCAVARAQFPVIPVPVPLSISNSSPAIADINEDGRVVPPLVDALVSGTICPH